MEIRSIDWVKNGIKIIDQTKIPAKLEYLHITDLKILWNAIKELKVRGAPALGAAAALGVYLGVKDSKAKNFIEFSKNMDLVIQYLGSSRPTARNLFWGLERMASIAVRNKEKSIKDIKRLLYEEGLKLMEEDRISCRNIGKYGEKLINNNDTILTICNAGILATVDYGTALAVMYKAKEADKKFKVYACETRPLLQGARLTTWELYNKGIDVTLICDSMAATLMKQGLISKVITGADRIAANGDTANKIGTYNLAVLSKFHKIPFFIAAPESTFDCSIADGSQIHIEERPASEIKELFFKDLVVHKKVKVFNPAFDVTDNKLITGIISDKGIIYPPYKKNIPKLLKSC